MMNIKKALGLLLTMLFAGQAYAYNCSGVAQYSNGSSYNTNSIVQNLGIAYRCTVGGWCSVGGPYAPGAGWAWENAWTSLGSCGSTGGGTSSSSSSSSSGNTGGGNTGGSCPNWSAGTNYTVGTVVRYNGSFYRAKNENPGYDPVISTWFWEPVASCPGGNGGNNGGGNTSCAAWVAGTNYYAGNIVSHNGSYFIAEHDNPGYDPLISTWFWEPVASCSGGSGGGSSSSTGNPNPGTGFAAIVSEAQFNQMFPNRNPFYTYSGLVAATASFPGFANTGDVAIRKREAAAALANFSHETGAFVHITEIAQGLYCGDWDNNPSTCPCQPGKSYYGRGPIQLSWNGNYCAAGAALNLDLRANPDLVAQNPTVAWQTALWFWMTQSGAGYRPAHSSITGGYGFGETIRTINGSLECNGGNPGQVQSRINDYRRILQIIGGTEGNNISC
jgi:predicted chitinase